MNPKAELDALAQPFPSERELFRKVEHQPAGLLPDVYRKMLAHDHHMTVTMEEYHGGPVEVGVLAETYDEANDLYHRKIVLKREGTDRVVQFGLVRFDFQYVRPEVKAQILAKETPLGRVLINYNVLRHVDLNALLRITMGEELADLFEAVPGEVTYGRLATLFCNHQPAVDLLEISAPLPE